MYLDPHRHRPRFELPGSAGAGPRNQTTLPVSWETCMHVKKQQLEEDMEQLTGSKFGKEYDKAAYCHHICLIYMQSAAAAAKSLQ